MLDTIFEGLVKLFSVKTSRKALVVISDGAGNHSRHTYRDVKKLVRESNVQIYTVGVFEPPEFRLRTPEETAGPGLLAALANISGGRAFSVSLAGDIPDITSLISDTLRSQYVVGYIPSNLVRAGRWLIVRIKLRPLGGLPRLQVYTRSGHYAPTHYALWGTRTADRLSLWRLSFRHVPQAVCPVTHFV